MIAVATQVELEQAYALGEDAYVHGLQPGSCPFRGELALWWHAGWQRARDAGRVVW